MQSLLVGVDADFPDQVSASLVRANRARQLCVAFNTAATLLAVGSADGVIVLYDFETRGVARLLRAHTAPVVSLSWNASSHHLLSAATDGTIIRWDVLAGKPASAANVNAGAPGGSDAKSKTIKRVQLHPTIDDLALLTFSDSDHPLLVELDPLASVASSAEGHTHAPSPHPSSSPSLTAAATPEQIAAALATPRLPLWSRYVTAPYVTPASQIAPTAGAAAPAATPPDTSAAPAQDGGDTAMTPAGESSDSAPAPASATGSEQKQQQSNPQHDHDHTLYYTRWVSTVALFDRTGRFVFEGNNKGTVVLHQLHYDAAVHAQHRAQRAAETAAAVAAAATSGNKDAPLALQAAGAGAEELPPWLRLRAVFVESLPAPLRRGRLPAMGVQSIVQSNCGRFLLVNIAAALKVYRVDTALLQPRGASQRLAAQQALDALAAYVESDADTQETLANGARYFRPAHHEKKSKQQMRRAANNRDAEGNAMADANAGDSAQAAPSAEADIPYSQLSKKERERVRKQERKERERLAREQRARETAEAAAAAEGAEHKSANNSDADEDDNNEAEADARRQATGGMQQPVLDYLRTLSDQVNRVPWRRCAFNASGEYVLGGSAERGEHRIHIWSLLTGQLTKMLLCPTEALLDLAAHPRLPLLVSAGSSGAVYLWTRKVVENWSAFAPDFEELDDNREYIEREDEFDLKPEAEAGAAAQAKLQQREAGSEIDVLREDEEEDVDELGFVTSGGGFFAEGAPVGVPPRSKQLVALPTTVQPDATTAAAYAARRAAALAKLAQAQAQETTTANGSPSAAAPMDSTPTATPQASKRALDDPAAQAAAEEANKKARV